MFTDKSQPRFVIAPTVKNFILYGKTMGTHYSANFFAPADLAIDEVNQALQLAVDKIDNQMSPWKKQSDLVRFNNTPEGKWVNIPDEMATVMIEALHISRLTKGAFNIGVGELVNVWGFGPTQTIPEKTALETNTVITPANEVLELDLRHNRLRKHAPITIDLCGIAKGFGVDELARALQSFGIEDFLVSIDGEIKASGLKGDSNNPWVVGIEKPDYQHRDVFKHIEISNMSLATSGDYRKFKQIGDTHISHTIDTATGAPALNNIASVTVATEKCMTSDALATAFLVLGKEQAVTLANDMQADVFIIERHASGYRQHAAGAFVQLMD